jgi:hypothetical protein
VFGPVHPDQTADAAEKPETNPRRRAELEVCAQERVRLEVANDPAAPLNALELDRRRFLLGLQPAVTTEVGNIRPALKVAFRRQIVEGFRLYFRPVDRLRPHLHCRGPEKIAAQQMIAAVTDRNRRIVRCNSKRPYRIKRPNHFDRQKYRL